MNEVTNTGTGMSVDVNIDNPIAGQLDPGAATSNPFLESLPEAFRSKERFVNFSKAADPMSELLKSYENQEAKISQKSEGLRIPGEGATPEDWNNFHKAIGVPETPDKYEYKAPENIPEHLKPYFATDPELLKVVNDAFVKAGVRQGAEKHIYEAVDNYYLSKLDETINNVNQKLETLETNFKQKFGDRSNQVLENFNKSMAGLLGKDETEVIESLDPTVKVVLAQYHEAFAKKYIREDNLGLDVPNAASAMTEKQYGDEFERLFAITRSTPVHSPEHLKAQMDLAALREKGQTIFKK